MSVTAEDRAKIMIVWNAYKLARRDGDIIEQRRLSQQFKRLTRNFERVAPVDVDGMPSPTTRGKKRGARGGLISDASH